MNPKMKLYKVVGRNEWCQSTRVITVHAKDAKQAREIALNTRTIDGGVVSCREVKGNRAGVVSSE